jgi:hypothetical protein
MTVEQQVEINKRSREEELARRLEGVPKPGPRPELPPISDEELKLALRIGPPYPPHIARHFREFGAQVVERLPEAPRRDVNGNPPVEDGRSEADRLRDPATKIAALEARITRLEDIVARQLGAALDGAGEVYR